MTFRRPNLTPASRPSKGVAVSSATNLPLNAVVTPLPFRWQFLTPSTRVRVTRSDASYRWINTAIVPAPNRPPDLSSSRFSKTLPPPQFPNLVVTTNPVVVAPFYTKDFSRPFVPVNAKPNQQSLNLNLYTNPIPFAQTDWSSTRFRVYPTQDNLPNIALLNFVANTPVIPYDWGKQQQNPDFQVLPQYPNLNINTVGSPLIPYDWGKQQLNPGFQPVPIYPNIALIQAPVFAPFYTQDFSKPFVPTPAKSDQQSLNLNLYTNDIPFAQYDWSKTGQYKTILPDQSNLPNIVLLAPAVVASPFYPVDFSKPFTPVPAKPDQQALNINLYTNPIPFGPYDYSSRFVDRFTPVDQNGVPNLVLGNFSTPFVSYDWSKPKAVKASIDPQYPNLILLQPVGDPFNQLDWSKAFTIPPKSSNQNDLPNLLLIQPSVPSNPLGVYGWIDWSRTQKPVIIVPDQNNLPNIVLPNTIPVPPEIIVASGRWIKGVEALRAKAAEQARSNDRAVKQAAAVLSRMGGIARAQALTATQRSKIATNAAKARWK